MAEVSAEQLLAFYRRLYPFKSLFQWLNHEHTPTKLWTHREFSFTLPNEVFIRYNSFSNADDMKKQVCALNPTRFDIGPVFNTRPKDKKTTRAPLTPERRELVFDIDMTDYDPIRTCCSGADICHRCWAFISAAVRVLHDALSDQFGFKHMLWVYSGRRGIHLWVSDKEAMELTDEQRKAIVGYLTAVSSPKQKIIIRSGTRPLHPSLQTAVEYLKTVFQDVILEDQDLFSNEEAWDALLEMIPDKDIAEKLKEPKKGKSLDSVEKWDEIRRQAMENKGARPKMKAAMEEMIIQYTYPRLDAEVSKHRNHLLKAPFCIHPKTGRVCVPVDPDQIDKFDPSKVPTIHQLLDELDKSHMDTDGEHHADWEKTSLKPYVDMLDKFSLSLMNEVRKEKREVDMTW